MPSESKRREKKKLELKLKGKCKFGRSQLFFHFLSNKKKTIAISISIPFHQMNQVRNMKLPTNIGN